MQALKIRVRGRVQGVGFRAFTQRTGQDLGLTGWVRNLADGSVEVQVAGAQQELERFQALLRRGPAGSRVADLEAVPLPTVPAWDRFEVRS